MIITREIVNTLEHTALTNGNEHIYHSLDILAVVEHIRNQEAEINRLRAEITALKAAAAPVTEAPAVASEPTRRPTLGDAIDSVISTGDKVRITKGADTGVTCTAITIGRHTASVYMPDGRYEVFRRDAIEKL